MSKKFISLCYAITLLIFSLHTLAQEEFSSSQIKQLKNGIFEVVTLKLEDNTVYKEPFPFELLPFQTRNDKYHSLGTAFLIKDNVFASAAHVFDIGSYSLLAKNYALRDGKGNIFKITNVEKYSNYRDLIQFTVQGDTSKYHKFKFADEYEEGDVIYAAGNAHGEGVIFRKGILTSFTYEPIDGKWKNIRFSAAASPGNSGGPLLNLAGEVVGIVTRKSSNENLNFAFPIKEFNTFSSKQAEFYETKMGEFESTKSLRYKWEFSADLPQDMLALRALAEKSFYQRFISGRDEFVEKFKDDLFPNHTKVKKYLKNQSSSTSLSIIDINGNGEWSLIEPDNQKKIKIGKEQSLWFGQSDSMLGNYQFFMEKPEEQKLADFVANKNKILETFLTSVQWNRPIEGTKVYINSYGEPIFEEHYTDNFGRVWQMALWNDQYSNRGIMIYCLPIPQGINCELVESPVAWLEFQKQSYKANLHRMMLSYSAKLNQWTEFLQLPTDAIPQFLQDAKLLLSDDKVNFEVGSFSGSLDNMKLTGDSNFHVTVEINPDDVNELIVGNISFQPNLNEDGIYYVSKYYDLGNDASDNYNDFWHKFTTLKSPYNFEVINEGKINSKYINLGANGKSPKVVGNQPQGVAYLAACKLQSEVKLAEFNAACDSFVNGLH
ncbi:serine protease [Paraglaciecola aquimarina]|uniref:Serine protease n=1 Tax=Paraglaciecola aquimarina TaxID=1235557 RepID=A0ABU3SX16_9ALTE|nr:serine protease [Paraglaciecola aquimarina]MDU0354462.1 serine protease [Paraglaciecola aquimarina]